MFNNCSEDAIAAVKTNSPLDRLKSITWPWAISAVAAVLVVLYYAIPNGTAGRTIISIAMAFAFAALISAGVYLAKDRRRLRAEAVKREAEMERLKQERLESAGFLTGSLANEFNESLTAVINRITLARLYSGPGGEVYKKLGEAESAAFKARGLVQQLLTFSKDYSPKVQGVGLKEFIEETVGFFMKGSSVKCEFHLGDGLPIVAMDRQRMGRALGDILSGFVRAMPEGGRLKISARKARIGYREIQSLPEGGYARITIAESSGGGAGRPDAALMFDPAYGIKRGEGLALASAYSIIKKHGGHVTADSGEHGGIAYDIYLPASSGAQEAGGLDAAKARADAGNAMKVLLIEPDEAARRACADMLGSLECSVLSASNGVEGIRMFREARATNNPCDIVIVDLAANSDGISGMETFKLLKRLSPDINAVAVGAEASDTVAANYGKLGFRGYVRKPCEMDDMRRILDEASSEAAVRTG